MILKVIFANSVDPDQTAPHCLPVCKNRFEKSARIFSRRHKQTTFSDAVFLGLRGGTSVKIVLPHSEKRYSERKEFAFKPSGANSFLSE